jgi:predicted membrane channel-forming protein YqfA (hemolysin III family)
MDVVERFIENLEAVIDQFEADNNFNPQHSLCFYSNLFMLIPTAFTMVKGMKLFSFCIFYCMVCSMIYHYNAHVSTFCLDATGIVLVFGILIYLSKYNRSRLALLCLPPYLYFIFGIGFWALASSYKNINDHKKYDLYHGCWHILVAFSLMNFFYVYYYRNMY